MPKISKFTLADNQRLYDYLRDLEGQVDDLKRSLATVSAAASSAASVPAVQVDVSSIRNALELHGAVPLNVTGLLGRLAEAQDARIPRLTAHPDPLVVTYSLYILVGTPDTIWGINRDVNPPTRYQLVLSVTSFGDNVFYVYDDADTTKKVAFDVGTLVATGTTRTMGVPNVDQVLAGRNVDNAFSSTQTFNGQIVAGYISGTPLLVNPASIAANTPLIDLQVAGVSKASIDAEGDAVMATLVLSGLLNVGGVLSANGRLQANAGLTLAGLLVNSSPVTITTANILVEVDTSAARTVKFPAAPSGGEIHFIKDGTGSAAANNITVDGNGKNIDGAATQVVNVNRAGFGYYYNGTQWLIIAKF